MYKKVSGDLQPSRVTGLNSSCAIPEFSGQEHALGFPGCPHSPAAQPGLGAQAAGRFGYALQLPSCLKLSQA